MHLVVIKHCIYVVKMHNHSHLKKKLFKSTFMLERRENVLCLNNIIVKLMCKVKDVNNINNFLSTN